jgi:hypothetical protein
MDDIDTNWQTDYAGKDGQDGDLGTYEIDQLPN